jgi:hypothetical protein
MSTIDNLPIGSLIWDDMEFAGYNSASEYQKVMSKYVALGGFTTGVKAVPNAATDIVLSQNYPNPFNPSTTIHYALPHQSYVTLTIYDVLGQKVAELVNGVVDAGSHDVKFDGSRLASGVYFYRLQAGGFVQTKRLMSLR